jgi:ABC-type multidrug transport system ATPase subunit
VPLDSYIAPCCPELGLDRPRPVKIAYKNLTFAAGTPTKRVILDNMSGVFGPAELVAIMGPSGAGKTTLLSLLTGQIQRFESGTIELNNEPMDTVILRKHSALVGQDNLLLGSLTPLDSLTFAAYIKLGPSVPEARKIQKVDALLKQFGLSECETTLVGVAGGAKGLSGGQQKRLAIALEMVSSPSLIFLDEPTSSLDSYSSMLVVDRLRLMAEHGHTVVSTIHQPSAAILFKFHTLLLLAKGGTVYFGPTSRIVEYFEMIDKPIPENTNPADFAMEQVSGTTAYIVG